MLVRIEDEWEYEAEVRRVVLFASVSVVGGQVAEITVLHNGELIDRVNTTVPHSWWKLAGQPLCPPLEPGDRLVIETTNPIDLRIDFE